MKPDKTFLKQLIRDLNIENNNLKSEVAYLKGEINVYERFLIEHGFIKGDPHAS